jgi:hypothetical protein
MPEFKSDIDCERSFVLLINKIFFSSFLPIILVVDEYFRIRYLHHVLMYNFVLHNHLHTYLLFQLIVENDEDLDDQYSDQNALKKRNFFFVKLK